MKKKIIIITNRYTGIKPIIESSIFDIVAIFFEKNSYFCKVKEIIPVSLNTKYIEISSKENLVNFLSVNDYDLLIANGCKYILPISKLREDNRIFINIHPSYLPYLKGKHPVNGTIKFKKKYYGVTAHYMDDKIDTGNIIFQKKIQIGNDISLPLLYYIMLNLEQEIGKELCKLIYNNKLGEGLVHSGGEYYSKEKKDYTKNCIECDAEEINLSIKSFGLRSQGVELQLLDRKIIAISSNVIYNKYINKLNTEIKPGTIVHETEDVIVVKCRKGILSINQWKIE